MTIPLLADPALQAQAQKDAKILETTLKNTKAGTGTHDKGAIGALLARHTPEVQACYEGAAQRQPQARRHYHGQLFVGTITPVTGISRTNRPEWLRQSTV